MHVLTFPIGPLETNCYLAVEGSQALAVDPGGDPGALVDHLEANSLKLTHILLTHLHFDHTFGVKTLAEATGAPVFGNNEDAYLLQTEIGMGGLMGLPKVPPYSFEAMEPGEFQALGQTCKALPTPGHTPGSLTYYFPDASLAFVGDLIFYRSVGRSDFPGGDHETLVQAVISHIFSLPENTVLYPGHGETTTVGDEKMHNPFFTEFRR